LLRDLHATDPRVRVVTLSRNFGHQAAITAGLDHARGDAVVILDADLQDPPELIPAMVERWKQGYDVVYGVRTRRERESLWKRATAALFYRVLRRASAIEIPLDTGDFRLLSRPVVDALHSLRERHRFVRGLVAWAGFRPIGLPYTREGRDAGESKFPTSRMLRLAGDAVVSFSIVPLRLASAVGLTVSLTCFAYALFATWGRWMHDRPVPGWTSLMVAVLFVGGVQLICLGIIGEYIGRIYEEVKRRPLYVVAGRLETLPASSG
jgi:glycosyltransferase involved in cell wall biosynthesis